MRYYCPQCWHDFAEGFPRCPNCGSEVHHLLGDRDYVEKLIVALGHPEKETAIRAAWILGNLRDERAVEPLISFVGTTQDVYIACAAVKALGKLGTWRAYQFLEEVARAHPASMVRDLAAPAASGTFEVALRRRREPQRCQSEDAGRY